MGLATQHSAVWNGRRDVSAHGRDRFSGGPTGTLAGEFRAIHVAARGSHQRVQPRACRGIKPSFGLFAKRRGHGRDGTVDDNVQTLVKTPRARRRRVAAIVSRAVRTGGGA